MEGIPFSFEIKRDLSILGVVFIFLESLVIDLITKQLAQTFNLDSKTGLFFSAFDQEGKLLASHGVIKTDRTLNTLLQSLYLGILKQLEPQIKSIIFDVVEDLKLQNDPHLLAHLPLQEYGLFLVEGEGQKSGVILPNTKGIETTQQALLAIKKKYQLNNQVSLFTFKTKRVNIVL